MKCVWEHNGNDTILYAVEHVGAYGRGENLDAGIAKMKAEVNAYLLWKDQTSGKDSTVEIVMEKKSDLQIADADSDVLFDSERAPLSRVEYEELKALALRSAEDFHRLYLSVPDKNKSCMPRRKTFYGDVPRTAAEMYEHTKNVNSYYFGEIGIDADNEGTIYECRERGFALLEQTSGFLENQTVEGSYGELWSLRKMMRRFIWHDRIHAKAMYRMATKAFGNDGIANIFHFSVSSMIIENPSVW